MDQVGGIYLNLCILWTLLAFGMAIEQNDNTNIDHSFEELSTHLLGLENQDFCTSKDIVLFAGNVQTCKTTLILHLTDSNIAASVHVDTRNNFHGDIDANTDRSNQINVSPSETITPQLISDQLNGINYYNCLNFGAHQSLEHDILAMASVKKLLDCSRRRIKFVFTINLPPNRLFEVSRADFLSLAEHATAFVKNITKYRNSLMLVVTEFQDFYTNTDGQYQFINDQNMIARVSTFLYHVKESLENTNHWYADPNVKAGIIEFIDILLEKQENEYLKIGISRLQPHNSAARNLELLNDEKQRIISILHYRLQYVDASPMEFNTAISTGTENLIRRRIVEVQNHLSNDINSIDLAIKEFYASKETNMSDVFTFDGEIAVAILKLSAQIRPDQPKPFIGQITSIINELNISISNHYIEQLSNHIDYIDLLENFTAIESGPSRFFIPISPLKITIAYLNDIKKWYSFIIKFGTAMDRYTAQQRINLNDVADLLGNCTIFSKNNDGTNVNVNDIGLFEFVEKIGSQNIYQMISNMTVNGNMLSALKIAVGWAFKPIHEKCTEKKLTVIGYNVKISDLFSTDCMQSVSIIEIFAWNKLFIDADINKIGQGAQIGFFAPVWEIIGDRRIILSGENARPHAKMSQYGDGVPGMPGGSSGHFIGIGNSFVNDQQLEVVVVGGKGGDGQHGGGGDKSDRHNLATGVC